MSDYQEMLEHFDEMSGGDFIGPTLEELEASGRLVEPHPLLKGVDISQLDADSWTNLMTNMMEELGIPEEEFE